MEFRNPWEECSDDDEALSFCDLVTEQAIEEFALRDSNTEFLDQEGFGFDFDFGQCGSTTDHIFPADDLFRHGRLLPLPLQRCPSESVQYFSFEKSNSENLLAWRNDSLCSSSQRKTDSGEILPRSKSKSKGNRKPPALTWRNDSLDMQSSFWSTSTSSQRKAHSGEVFRLSNLKSKGNHKPPAAGGKMSAKWLSLTLGLIKTPPMKLEDMRVRQGKIKNSTNGAKNLNLRRSVSCNYNRDPQLEKKEANAVNFRNKCKAGKENVVIEKMAWLKGWKTLARYPSFNSCKTSSNAVVENGRFQKACKKSSGLR